MYIYWMLMLFVRLDEAKFSTLPSIRLERLLSCVNFILFFRFLTTLVFQLIALALQNHLFIWSVICPKLMYEGSLTLVTDLLLMTVVLFHKFFN
jgi:hypothetical protein